MAPDPLGGRVHDDVRAVLDRPAEGSRAEGVIHHQRNAGVVRDCRQGLEVRHVEPRIADGLDVEQAGARVDGGADLVEVVDVHEPGRDAPLGQGVGEQVVGAAVERLRRDQVVARARQVEHGERLGGLAAGHRERRDPALELGDPLLEHVARRVHDAGVDVAEHPQPEQIGGVLGVVENVARRRVDRDGARVGGRIGGLPGVHRQGIGMVRHAALLKVWENEKARTAQWSGPGLGVGWRASGLAAAARMCRGGRPPQTGETEHHSTAHRAASVHVSDFRSGSGRAHTRRPPARGARRACIRRFSSLVRPR